VSFAWFPVIPESDWQVEVTSEADDLLFLSSDANGSGHQKMLIVF
jgi:hypothetical protein